MAFEKREPIHDWRGMLTSDERARVRRLEKRRERLKEEGARISAELGPIRNRAIQRVRQSTTPDQKEA